MEHNRERDHDRPNRESNMEQAEGSRESIRETEAARRRESGRDLGSSSDRAMFDEESAEPRHESSSGRQASGSDNAGVISNRPLDVERREQDELPERGRSKSEG